ncbi:hypothetical protein ABGA94_17225, partial [Stenotrophomonas sp. 3diitr2024]
NHVYQAGARSYPGHTGSPLDLPAKTLKAGGHGVPGGENMLVKDDGSTSIWHLVDILGWLRARGSGKVTTEMTELAAAALQINLARTEAAAHRVNAVFDGAVRGLCSHAVNADGAAWVFAAAQRTAGLR